MCFFSFLMVIPNCKAISVRLKISDEYKQKRNHSLEHTQTSQQRDHTQKRNYKYIVKRLYFMMQTAYLW